MRPRAATPADVPALVALGEAAYARYVPRLDGREPPAMRPDFAEHIAEGAVRVVDGADGIEAYLIAYTQDGALVIENVAVAPGRQGAGRGRGLLAFAEDLARARGLGRLRLYTNVVMTENQRLYARLGYAETGRSTFGAGFERVHYEKSLRE
ncbi:MAG: GNAT family N-acetyltransferase [Paracoccaceae bacterium]